MRISLCAAGFAAMALGVAARPAVDDVNVKDMAVKGRGMVGDLVGMRRRGDVYPRATKTAGEPFPILQPALLYYLPGSNGYTQKSLVIRPGN